MVNYPNLFSEIEIAGRRLQNRICLCATVTNFARANKITDEWRNFLIERARGGAALLVTEIIAVDPEAIAQSSTVTGFDTTNEDAFQAIAVDVQKEGAMIIGQLWHPGRQQLWHPTKSPIGVSDLPDPYSGTVPHVMDKKEVYRVADAYIDTAKRLAQCGFDGVELHGAHGYLIMQFLSAASNNRNDEFGGDTKSRTLFVRRIAKGIKEACGKNFIVGLKMPADEGVEGGVDPDEAERITKLLSSTNNFDYFAYGQGNFSLSLENHVPDLYFKEAHFIDLHKRMRDAANGVPVMALGRIGDPTVAEDVIAKGNGDLVGMSRALISDPALPKKARQGDIQNIRPCVFDNFAWGEIHLGKPLTEHHNPYLGKENEAFYKLKTAEFAKRVLVLGGGPSGLEAAWVAAARGHGVTLFCGSQRLGGSLIAESTLPGRSEMAKIINYQVYQGNTYGVEYVLNHRATSSDVIEFGADEVVLATGSIQREPKGLNNSDQVISARHFASNFDQYTGERAVLIDEDFSAATYGVADLLAKNFNKVFLVTSRPRLAGNVNHCSAIGVFRRLYSADIDIRPAQETIGFSSNELILKNPFSQVETKISEVDLVVYSTPRISTDDLAPEISGINWHRIGDSRSPRNLLAAIQGGHALALDL